MPLEFRGQVVACRGRKCGQMQVCNHNYDLKLLIWTGTNHVPWANCWSLANITHCCSWRMALGTLQRFCARCSAPYLTTTLSVRNRVCVLSCSSSVVVIVGAVQKFTMNATGVSNFFFPGTQLRKPAMCSEHCHYSIACHTIFQTLQEHTGMLKSFPCLHSVCDCPWHFLIRQGWVWPMQRLICDWGWF